MTVELIEKIKTEVTLTKENVAIGPVFQNIKYTATMDKRIFDDLELYRYERETVVKMIKTAFEIKGLHLGGKNIKYYEQKHNKNISFML